MEQWYLYKKKADFNQIGEKFNIDPVIASTFCRCLKHMQNMEVLCHTLF